MGKSIAEVKKCPKAFEEKCCSQVDPVGTIIWLKTVGVNVDEMVRSCGFAAILIYVGRSVGVQRSCC